MFVSRECTIMIFVTIGTQEPFDRLLKAVDEMVPDFENEEFIVQGSIKTYRPVNFTMVDFMDPMEFKKNFDNAGLIISHAGMGTILSAMIKTKTLLILPRMVKYGEHRNEHQLATAKKFSKLNYINVAKNEDQLKMMLSRENRKKLISSKKIGEYASADLVNSIRNFLTN